jgi:TonB-dependent SusC/RagA subfamily outer membrane receptor
MLSLYKKTFLLIIILGFVTGNVFAQKLLTPSRQSSFYTYIYKIGPADVLKFYKYPGQYPDEKILHNPVDSFKTDDNWKNNLPAGNYLKVYAEKNKLRYKLIENRSAYLKVMRNNYDLSFTLTDNLGNPVNSAVVTSEGSTISADPLTRLYHTKLRETTLVKVNYAGVTNYFELKQNRGYNLPFFSRRWFAAKWYRLKRWFKKDENSNKDEYKYRQRLYENEKYTGIIAFNKPLYKPLDTVKLKAFIVGRKSRNAIDHKRLLVRIQEGYNDNGKILGYVDAYRKGGYEYSFALTDSLDLDLDSEYFITLEDPSSAKYDPDKNEDKDEDKVLAMRKVFIAGKFKYEEYELKSTTFSVRTDKNEHEPGNPVAVYLKATDENDLPVPDGRVAIKLITGSVPRFKTDKIFVPDTLWTQQLKLDAVGETKVTIPDSIFPKADINYRMEAELLSSDNERHSQTEYLNFKYNNYKLKYGYAGDSLKITSLFLGKAASLPACINAINFTGDTVSRMNVTLPATVIVNPNIRSYFVKADSAALDIKVWQVQADLNFSGYQTADSLFVKVSNPHHIHFWYWLLNNNNNQIDAGEGNNLDYKKSYTNKDPVVFVLSYVWGGENRYTGLAIPYKDKLLDIKVKQPITVYPGQQVKTEIEVKDVAGKPVAGVDITAWALTRKFPNYTAPFVPYLGKAYKNMVTKPFANLSTIEKEGSLPLNWKRWSREIGLDSIAYFQFTHPATTYKIQEQAPDSLTQIAPFVVKNGEIVPVHILYIDGIPVYFSQAQQLQRYSFAVTPGYHNLRFRTFDNIIRLNNVIVDRGKKMILSVNADTLINKTAVFEKATDTLSRYEADVLNKHMIRVVNNWGAKMVTLEQDGQVLLLNPGVNNNGGNEILVGPLANNITNFKISGETARAFIAEPGYSYLFEPGLLKQKSINTQYPFDRQTFRGAATEDYTQYALTKTETEKIWSRYLDLRSQTMHLFHNNTPVGDKLGSLSISVAQKNGLMPFIKNVIIYKDGDPDFMNVYEGTTTDFGKLDAGSYRIFFLLEKNTYYIKSNIGVKPYGRNFYEVTVIPQKQDSVSTQINEVINNRPGAYNYQDYSANNDALKLKEAFNSKYIDENNFKNMMYGRVVAQDDGLPLVGCTVKVKGMRSGVTTDMNGRFVIKVPNTGTLLFNYIGYQSLEMTIHPATTVQAVLQPNNSQLNEVVVIGYGTQRRQSVTGSVSVVTSSSMGNISIRGITSLDNGKPLIVVDGVIVENMDGIDANAIGSINTLKDAAARAIYGQRGANGVIVIITKKKTGEATADGAPQGTEQSLRKNFSDYAYWQPKLTTDAQGKASFTATFPDDITNWRTFVIGINDRQQSGYADGQIKSFKPISANFITPQFAVTGDEMKLIGKVMNYNTDAVKLTRTFTYNGQQVKQDAITVTNSKIDTLGIVADNTDSLSFEYTIKRDNGYFDGERRKVPVIKQGVEETKGVFNALNSDTTVNLKFDPAMGPVTFRAEASVLPTLAEETRKLREYKYLCNEQLASKLKGLLAERRIKKFLGEEFKYGKNIQEAIKKLQENRKTNGTWGWWKDTDEELWISLHAVEALLDAQKEGYMIQLDKQKLTDYLVYQLESYRGADKLTCLELLHKLNAKIDYKKYIDVVEKGNRAFKQKTGFSLSTYDIFRLMLVKQEAGLPVKLDSLFASEHHTMFGNTYWGDDSYRFFDNSVQLSILAYHIIKAEAKHPELLRKIQGYFLEHRSHGEWRNTYESALILETILPDLLVADKQVKPSAITIKGAATQTISTFPYSATFKPENISISKTGSLPVYITGSQKFWNTRPEKVSKDFTVNTWFERKEQTVTSLKGGEVVQLQAEVIARGDADFVMIEIPIPAGCSYENKDQPWSNNEVHREYFKEKVSIFCRKLKQNKYTFTVNLIPRYDGKYTLNPAKAEMMYFPVFYGREGMKQVVIGSLSH